MVTQQVSMEQGSGQATRPSKCLHSSHSKSFFFNKDVGVTPLDTTSSRSQNWDPRSCPRNVPVSAKLASIPPQPHSKQHNFKASCLVPYGLLKYQNKSVDERIMYSPV